MRHVFPEPMPVGVSVQHIMKRLPQKMQARENYAAAHAKAMETGDVEDMRVAVAAWDTYYQMIGGDREFDRPGFWRDQRDQMRKNQWTSNGTGDR